MYGNAVLVAKTSIVHGHDTVRYSTQPVVALLGHLSVNFGPHWS